MNLVVVSLGRALVSAYLKSLLPIWLSNYVICMFVSQKGTILQVLWKYSFSLDYVEQWQYGCDTCGLRSVSQAFKALLCWRGEDP